jgi:hypothetical protein
MVERALPKNSVLTEGDYRENAPVPDDHSVDRIAITGPTS